MASSTTCDSGQLGVIRPAYMSLPSPNIPSTEDEKQKGAEGLSWHNWNTGGYDTVGEDQETSSTLQERRGALVPPKMGMASEERSGRESSCSR